MLPDPGPKERTLTLKCLVCMSVMRLPREQVVGVDWHRPAGPGGRT
jgi:hypothetical protein